MNIKKTERLAQMIEMRNAGVTYQEIGNIYGISKQRAYDVLRKHCPRKKYKEFKVEECIYSGLRDWLIETKMPLYKFECIYTGKVVDVATVTTRSRLLGVRDFKISEIERILEFTGKTYEELFKKGER